jgi:hypothetical protein
MRTQALMLVVALTSSVTASPVCRGQSPTPSTEPTARSQDFSEACAIPPSDGWELLSVPPPESDQMLAITSRPLPYKIVEPPVQKEAWFRSKGGTFRYCRYFAATDRCDASSSFIDFQRRGLGWQWQGVAAGGTQHCPVHPQKCGARSQSAEDSRVNTGGADETAAPAIALRLVAKRLSETWLAPSDDVRMTITVRPNGRGDYFLHFCVENTSAHALEVNGSLLPWETPNLLTFTVLNASGKIVYTTNRFFDQLIGPPARRTIDPWDSAEADLSLSSFDFYAAAAHEDLLMMWSGKIVLYEGNSFGKAIPVSGITFVPKH